MIGVADRIQLRLYNIYLPPERVHAELLAPDVMRCKPGNPVAAAITADGPQPERHLLEVSMSTWVESFSNHTVFAEDRMAITENPTIKTSN